jgi:AcrR family transcriptional regulator
MNNVERQPQRRNSKAANYHHGDLRRSLVQAALELAAEEQDWNFSLREVARRAGVSHNAPYSHFAHKRDLMAAAGAAGHELLRNELIAAVAGITDPRAAVLKMFSGWINFGSRNPTLYRLMFSARLSGPDWNPEQVLAAGVATRALLEDILRRGARSGVFAPVLTRKSELQAASLHAWGTVHGMTMLVIDGLATLKEVTSKRIAQRVLTTISQGVKAGR